MMKVKLLSENVTPTELPGNPDVLRALIDRGLTYDKVAASDPAAAPLGTDDEAAGTRITPAMVAEALRVESTPVLIPAEWPGRWGVFLIIFAVFLLYALIAMLTVFK
jgi:hypothetical protein